MINHLRGFGLAIVGASALVGSLAGGGGIVLDCPGTLDIDGDGGRRGARPPEPSDRVIGGGFVGLKDGRMDNHFRME